MYIAGGSYTIRAQGDAVSASGALRVDGGTFDLTTGEGSASVTMDTGEMQTVVYVQADSAPDNAIELPDTGEEIPAGFYPVPVEIGISDDYNVEIKSGVEEGTVVFTQMITSEVWG